MEDDLKYLKIEDNLNFENGRRPHFLKMEDNLNITKMDENLNFFENGRRPQWKMTLFL